VLQGAQRRRMSTSVNSSFSTSFFSSACEYRQHPAAIVEARNTFRYVGNRPAGALADSVKHGLRLVAEPVWRRQPQKPSAP
jgi:hypothetical protein